MTNTIKSIFKGQGPDNRLTALSRRHFLTAAGPAVAAATVAVRATAAEPEMTPREQAWWHIRELERLIIADGGKRPLIVVHSDYGHKDFRAIGINVRGSDVDDGMFARKGGAA
jgi:hypothetical protein